MFSLLSSLDYSWPNRFFSNLFAKVAKFIMAALPDLNCMVVQTHFLALLSSVERLVLVDLLNEINFSTVLEPKEGFHGVGGPLFVNKSFVCFSICDIFI